MKIKINFLDINRFARHFYRKQIYVEKFNNFFDEVIRNSSDDIYWFLEGELPGQVIEGIKLVDSTGKETAKIVLEETWGE